MKRKYNLFALHNGPLWIKIQQHKLVNGLLLL